VRARSTPGQNNPPIIVAHRGYAALYPENTLAAVRAALEAGVDHVEVDVLMSSDGVPVLMHDATLERTAGLPDAVAALTWSELAGLEAAERARLGERGAGSRVPSLAELVALLAQWPHAQVFVEIKRSALASHGLDHTVRRVCEEVSPIGEHAIVISFSSEAIERARAFGVRSVGWVLERYDEEAHELARRLAPDFLFCNHVKFPAVPAVPWRGRWSWVAYEIGGDARLARDLAARGVHYVETMAVAELKAALEERAR
jgi:glycerophosphoryl diester phosphodiesterase